MLISVYSGGRMGNQLIHLTNLLASSIEYGFDFKNLSFKASEYFEINAKSLSMIENIWAPKRVFVLQKLIKLCYILNIKLPALKYIIEDSDRANVIFRDSNGKLVVGYVWPYYDFHSLYKHQEKVRSAFIPKSEYLVSSNKFISSCRKEVDVLIGVHIRRTDYMEWMGGKYCFDVEIYKHYIEKTAVLFKNKRVGMVLFSDEQINLEIFGDCPFNIFVSNNSGIVDLMAMAQCDYLIGPPSTYSGWASFWGNVPKYIMLNSYDWEKIKDLTCFKVYLTEVSDDGVDKNGNKFLSHIVKGKIVCTN